MELKTQIQQCLQVFASSDSGANLRTASIDLLNTLGYKSEKTLDLDGSPAVFLEQFDTNPDRPFAKDKALFDDWKEIQLLFQLTDQELSGQNKLFAENEVKQGLMSSYLFFAIELNKRDYARGKLTAIARQLNRVFPMPVMVFIKHRDLLSIAVINRRLNKRDNEKDVLGKVTIIRDISLTNPHRGHLDILSSFALQNLKGIHSFDTLHTAWEEIFNVELLNKRFYKELSNWYFWTLQEVRFPDDMKPADLTAEQETSYYEKLRATGLIRLLTRLIFCWFLKEKDLIPESLFDQEELAGILKNLDDDKPTYHQAILQNLFFATLNQRMNARGEKYRIFAKDEGFLKNRNTYGVDNLYRYESLFKDPESALMQFEDIPFLNGGLFECLDRTDDKGKKIYVDGFSRNKKKRPSIPNRFFFGEGEVNIGAVTGEKRRGTEKARGLIHILSAYKFTIVENTPIDQEIALDPELLGKVFENLLASYNEETKTNARKQTGSFYTPRPIVDYMVDESLKAHLTTAMAKKQGMKEDDARIGLDILFAYTEKQHVFDEDEVDTLIEAIDSCKILDPACGSGAFPMGILHKLVYILTKLDPDNVKWKQTQLAKLDSVPMREELERTFENNNDDYGRKLYLIENCLYGVDIQPIAIQISKLRFFISLICDQKTNMDKAKNHGVKPLPNLETKFVAADTLIGLAEETQMELFKSPKVVKIEQELQQVRHDHFSVQKRQKKLALQRKDKELRDELANELMQASFADQETSLKLANWNPYDPHVAADFFEPLWMFDRSLSEGFDIVIGNPPYISVEKFSGTSIQKQWKKIYSTYAARGDVYSFFYERGSKLLAENGHLSYITSNKWMRAGYGRKLREYFSEQANVTKVLDFGMAQNFGAATTYTCILDLFNTKPTGTTLSCYVADDRAAMADPAAYFSSNAVILNNLSSEAWVVLSKDRQRIKTMVEEQGTPLKQWNIKISRGIITGYNDAFYITGEQRDAIVADDPKSDEIIGKLLRGRYIERYSTSWDGTYQLVVKYGSYKYLENKYPSVYKHLKQHEERLKSRGQCRYSRTRSASQIINDYSGQHHWLELDNNPTDEYLGSFTIPKIMYPNMTKYLPFYYDEKTHFFTNDKGFIITSTGDSLAYLTAFLNSHLFRCCFRDNFPELMGNTYEVRKIFIDEIPVKKPTEAQKTLFDKLVALVQTAKAQVEPETCVQSELVEEIIDACVMECYFLDHMKERDLLFHADTAVLIENYNLQASESEQLDFLENFYQTANAPDHPIRNRLIRLSADSPDLLAMIKEEGKV